jgi:hypothetical protein
MSQKERPLGANPNVTVVEADRIDPVTQNTDIEEIIRKAAEAEAFANELVVVKIHKTTDKNRPNHTILSVNGTTQPVFFGVPTRIKRKYVEVLARMYESAYEQETNPTEPDRYTMRENAALVYPFDVIEDRNPRGREWLEHVLAERG